MARPPGVPPSSPSAGQPTAAIGAEALIALRADMRRFAHLLLRHDPSAEDLVQESIEAALRHAATFAGHSTLKTCLDRLPPNTGRVFMMREFLGFGCDEIGA